MGEKFKTIAFFKIKKAYSTKQMCILATLHSDWKQFFVDTRDLFTSCKHQAVWVAEANCKLVHLPVSITEADQIYCRILHQYRGWSSSSTAKTGQPPSLGGSGYKTALSSSMSTPSTAAALGV